ncbi:hypothetical protein HPP92_004070 [Vanilla planifolia]|uniref:Protein TIC 40, chloroplastic n=1 Tax=Vanilla planifolia TaxID=51239 RepID=A0A835S7E2_VANPL|nr:hypothetical protein HPP92_004070 [Vanilla planifolia]
MENLALSSTKYLVLSNSPTVNGFRIRRWPAYPSLPVTSSRRIRDSRGFMRVASSVRSGIGSGHEASHRISRTVQEKLGMENFASISSSNTVTLPRLAVFLRPPCHLHHPTLGHHFFWVGVGVGLSAIFSMVAARVKQYAMQQAFKTMMSQAAPQNGQFSNTAGSPFPFASQPTLAPPLVPDAPPTPSLSSQADFVADVTATEVKDDPLVEVKEQTENKSKTFAFADVSPEEVLKKDSEYAKELKEALSQAGSVSKEVSQNGAASSAITQKPDVASQQTHNRTSRSVLSVDVLEKMMEDPNVQKMVYPYLPEEMRNPTTFKWMLQNPQYRQQLQDMLNDMGGNSEWDNNLMESLKNFDLSSPEVKQQFDQIGLSPEEVISKIMANPEVALAFQNPKVQAAIMECSQNPLSISKYQNDKEVMDVFTKISELFPGVTGGRP